MKRVLTLLITLSIRLLFWLREVLLKHGWIDVQTPRDLYIHLQAARAQLANGKIQKLIFKAHESNQRFVLTSMDDDDDAVVDDFRGAGFIVDVPQSKTYTIRW